MRHHNKNRKFGRTRDVRKALLRSLARSLIERGHITTTEAKAKELRPFIEKLVTKGKKDTVSAHRLLTARLLSKTGAKKLITDVSSKYQKRNGGYTRITKFPRRSGDASPMARIEFI